MQLVEAKHAVVTEGTSGIGYSAVEPRPPLAEHVILPDDAPFPMPNELLGATRRTIRLPKAALQLSGAAALAVVLSAAAPSKAPPPHGTIQGTNAAVTHLAQGVGAFTYWMNGPDGEVITLLRKSHNNSAPAGGEDRDFVVRFSVVLAPGQTQTISVPGIDWANPPTIRIRRLGGSIEVTSSNTDQEGSNL
jgi:hypothetical protein